MPNTKSAKKRLRQDTRRRLQNRQVKSALKTYTKKVLAAIDEGNAEAAQRELRVATRKLDKAVSNGTLHRRTASRRKSRLAHLVNAMGNAGT